MKTSSYFHVGSVFYSVVFIFALSNMACSKRAAVYGTPAQLQVSTDSLVFSSTQTGQVERKVFEIRNNGDTTASLKQWAQLEAPFKILQPTEVASGVPLCTGDLQPHSSCTVVVEFRPETIGDFTQKFTAKFQSSLQSETALSLKVQGAGVPIPAAVLTFSPGSLWDFGPQFVGSQQSELLTLTNSGSAPAQILTTSFLNSPFSYIGGNFPGTGGTCGLRLEPQQSCTFAVDFSPVVSGNFISQFIVQYHDSRQLQISAFDILGEGRNTPEATLGISEGSLLHFGFADIGQSRSMVVTLNNSGSSDATGISTSTLSGAFRFVGGTYPGTNGNCGSTLPANSSCNLHLSFSPTLPGFTSDMLTFNYSHIFGTRQLQIGLDGTGSALQEALLNFSLGALYDFGSTFVNTTLNVTLTVTNTGDIEARSITPSPLSGGLSYTGGSYPGNGGTCGSSLAAASSCTIRISFAPVVGGAVSKTLSVQYFNGSQAATTSMVFSGVAIPKGVLDVNFGTNGLAELQIDALQTAKSLELQSDQKVIVAAEVSDGNHYDFALMRLNTNGSLDTTYSNLGITRTDLGFSSDDRLHSSTMQSNGRILLSGQSGSGVALARYLTNGSIDTSFNSNGLISGVNGLLISLTNAAEAAYSAAVSSAGHITLVGELFNSLNNNSFAAQFTSSGAARIVIFGLLGYRIYDYGSDDDGLRKARMDNADRIVSVGYRVASGRKQVLVTRTGLGGGNDNGFASYGYYSADLTGVGHHSETVDFVLQPDGKIVAIGYSESAPSQKDVLIFRLTESGALDTSFGAGGVVKIDLGSSHDEATSVDVDSNGRILVAANTSYNGNLTPAVIRLNANGSRDTSFGVNGVFLRPFSGQDAFIHSLRIQSDGKIITAGRVETKILVMRHLP